MAKAPLTFEARRVAATPYQRRSRASLAVGGVIAIGLVLSWSLGSQGWRIAAAVGALLFLLLNTFSKQILGDGKVRLSVSEEGLDWWENEQTTRISSNGVSSFAMTPTFPSTVLLRMRDGDEVRLEMHPDEARALAAALRLDPLSGRLSFAIPLPLLGPATILTAAVPLVGAYLAVRAMGVPIAFPLVLVLFALLRRVSGTLEVGSDGLLVRSLFGSRLVPFERVLSISPDTLFTGALAARVELDDGSSLSVALAPRNDDASFHVAFRSLADAFERFRDAKKLASVSAAQTALAAAADAEQRIALVSTQRTGGAGYRVAELPPEELRTLMADPTVPDRVRIAALAIGKDALGPEERIRVASSFDGSISKEVRVAAAEILEAQDEQQIEASLKKLG